MSKDLKNLINTVEKEATNTTELEQKIQSLKEEVNRLYFTIKEQKILIENLKNRSLGQTEGQNELPSEIQILKDIITSQRIELDKKDTDMENLLEKIEELSSGLDLGNKVNQKMINEEQLLDAQKLIIQLSEVNEEYKKEIELLRNQINDLEIEKSGIGDIEEDNQQNAENEELTNIKRLNFQLMEQNGLLRLEVESLKSQIQGFLEDSNSEELRLANEKNDVLLSKLKDYKTQIENLKEQLEISSEPAIISTADALEFTEMRNQIDNLNSELLKLKEENQELNNIINNLKAKMLQVKNEKIQTISSIKELPKIYQSSLFDIMYYLLEEDKKQIIIDLLIQNLNSKYIETKRTAIKILSKIKETKVYDAFLEALNDKNWLIRYSIIKALSEFEEKSDDLKVILNKFTRDTDVDVRELVLKLLSDITE